MSIKDFLPTGLPVLPDSALLRTLFEYRYALQLLHGTSADRQQAPCGGAASRVEQGVREAVSALEAEVRVRGLDGYLDDMGRFLSARLTTELADSGHRRHSVTTASCEPS